MIDQSNMLDRQESFHPKYRQAWMVCGLVVVVMLIAALTSSMFLLATKPKNTVPGSMEELGQQLSQLQQQREQQDAAIKQLQEDNRALQEEMAQQREQLEEVQSQGNSFQQQIQLLTSWILDLQSHSSGASTAMPSCPAMALSLLMTLLTAKWLH